MPEPDNLEFFLGGHDLEMLTIRQLLERHRPGRLHDKGLRWGAKTSDYASDIRACLDAGRTPVLIELEDDLGLHAERLVVVDHHGSAAGQDAATALEQVFALLRLPASEWTRWLELVAANDRGHVRGMQRVGAGLDEMQRVGAGLDEMQRVRAADRAAQGIGPEEEAAAAQAATQLEVTCDGRLHVARLAHARTSALVDRLDATLGGPGFRNLLVLSPGEVNVFGRGNLVVELDRQFPGGWYGGALPEQGYWGHQGVDGSEVRRFIEGWLQRGAI